MNTDASKQNNPELNMQVDKSRQINTDMYHTHINKKEHIHTTLNTKYHT